MNSICYFFIALSLLLGLTAMPALANGAETAARQAANEPGETTLTAGNPKMLVAYFSCTGTTRALAEQAARVLNADLYEITPREPYSEADLNYRNNESRSSREMNDAAARPAIAGNVADMAQYDVVLLGYPIWWGQAPRIISTFLASYDFTGKTIAPFCTSGGSGLGASDKNLYTLAPNAIWLNGARLRGGASQNDVAAWLKELGLFK